MIDYVDTEGFIVVAYRNQVLCLDVRESGVEEIEQSDKVVETVVDESKMEFLDLHQQYKIICI